MRLRRVYKYITSKTIQPSIRYYLSQNRRYTYKGLSIVVPPQVFHPAFFFSTRLLLAYLRKLDIHGKSLLELGAGSGVIAMTAAKRGAVVTATDINKTAVDYLISNAKVNDLQVFVYHSDLFKSIPHQYFDIIIINPPYYKKNPSSELDYAWYCGEDGLYFKSLFATLAPYIHSSTKVVMILCDECDFNMIKNYAHANGFQLDLQLAKKKYWETNFIYHISLAKKHS